jgi:hypothetical protein
MNKPLVLSVAVAAASAILVLGTPAAASAEVEPSGQDFGKHVSDCARTLGHSGSHNPGMHQGFSNWDGLPC